jgi:CubicO group peptidase (beta-lactamase class C family)
MKPYGRYLGAKYRRIASRRGPSKAVVAIERAMLVIIWQMSRTGAFYQGPDPTVTSDATPNTPNDVRSNSSAHLVSAVLAQALRQADGSNPRTVLDYATEKLFKPLGIDTRNTYTARFRPDDPTPFVKAGFGWATDAQAINIGAGLLRLRPADMLKFGQLYLDHGKWQGKQLIPERWVTESIAPSATSSQYRLM